jgi:hypothetical protein
VIRPTDITVGRCYQGRPSPLGVAVVSSEMREQADAVDRTPNLPRDAMTMIGSAVFCSFKGLGLRKSDPDKRSRL